MSHIGMNLEDSIYLDLSVWLKKVNVFLSFSH
jgi:hypothetical protein